jgi:hypothetical protein
MRDERQGRDTPEVPMMTHRRLALALCSTLVALACGPRHVNTAVRPVSIDEAVDCAIHVAEGYRFHESALGRRVSPEAVQLLLVPASGARNGPEVTVAVAQTDDSLTVHAVIYEGPTAQSPTVFTNVRHLTADINRFCAPPRADSSAS